MPNTLGIDIIGSGFGESIVLRMPNGKVGVIDCCSRVLRASDSAARRNGNATLRYVRDKLKVDRLAFIGLSHPHEDHGRGLSHFLLEYRDHIDEIWIFDAFQDISLERYFKALFDAKRRLPIERLLKEEPGTFSTELLLIRNLVLKQIAIANPRRAVPRVFCGQQEVEVAGEDVSIRFLGPSVALAQSYRAELQDNLKDVVDEQGRIRNMQWKPDNVNHNLASPALLVGYGQTQLILGGDMERQGWEEALRECGAGGVSLSCRLVKVSHHGSATGYIDGLYEEFGRDGLPIGVLTPFTRHRYPLPRREALEHLRPRTETLWATSIDNAQRSLGTVDPLSASEIVRFRSILQRWQADMAERPELRGALDPDFVVSIGDDIPERASQVPNGWIADLVAEPRLIALIHPDLRCQHLPPDEREERLEDVCRLSFEFGHDGHEIEDARYVGSRCGQLN
jgi:hypothetical protein